MTWTLLAVPLVPVWSALFCRVFSRSRDRFYFLWGGGAFLNAGIFAAGGFWPLALGHLVSAGIALVLWWLSRRRRKRAPRAYGARARALVAALVRRAREAARPRPALRPAPFPG